jgi:hypothetical protein
MTVNSEEDKDQIIEKWKITYTFSGRFWNGCKKPSDEMKLKSSIP